MPIIQNQVGDKTYTNLRLSPGEEIVVSKKKSGAGYQRPNGAQSFDLMTDDGQECSYYATAIAAAMLVPYDAGQRILIKKGPTQQSSITVLPIANAAIQSAPSAQTLNAPQPDSTRIAPTKYPSRPRQSNEKDKSIAFLSCEGHAAAAVAGSGVPANDLLGVVRLLRNSLYQDFLDKFYPEEQPADRGEDLSDLAAAAEEMFAGDEA